MITLTTPAFIKLTEETMTPQKVEQIHVLYSSPSKGKVQGWVFCYKNITPEAEKPTLQEVAGGMHTNYDQDYFVGENANVLEVIQDEFIEKLRELNPSITFTIQ